MKDPLNIANLFNDHFLNMREEIRLTNGTEWQTENVEPSNFFSQKQTIWSTFLNPVLEPDITETISRIKFFYHDVNNIGWVLFSGH